MDTDQLSIIKCEILFCPHKQGVGTPKGAESGVHAIRAFVSSQKISNKVVLKIDYKYAFNCVNRRVIMKKAQLPEVQNSLSHKC